MIFNCVQVLSKKSFSVTSLNGCEKGDVNGVNMTLVPLLAATLLNKDVIEKNQVAIEVVTGYSKVADIIRRTHFAMGEKASFKVSTSSTINERLNTNVFATTH